MYTRESLLIAATSKIFLYRTDTSEFEFSNTLTTMVDVSMFSSGITKTVSTVSSAKNVFVRSSPSYTLTSENTNSSFSFLVAV